MLQSNYPQVKINEKDCKVISLQLAKNKWKKNKINEKEKKYTLQNSSA